MTTTLGGLVIFMRMHRKFHVFADAGDPFKRMPVKLVIVSTCSASMFIPKFPFHEFKAILSSKSFLPEKHRLKGAPNYRFFSPQVDRLGEAICSGGVAEMWQRMATLPPGHQ